MKYKIQKGMNKISAPGEDRSGIAGYDGSRKQLFSLPYVWLITAVLSLILMGSHPFNSHAYEIAGKGVDPRTGNALTPTYIGESYGIDASTLTLQEIENYKGGWSWIDVENDGLAERYYLLTQNTYLINGMTPDGFYVNEKGQWTVDGMIQYRQGPDPNTVCLAALKAQELHGNSFEGFYSGSVKFSGAKEKTYGISVEQISATELKVSIGDDEGVTSYEYEYDGLNNYHNGVTMWKPKKQKKGDYLLFYGYNFIVYYNFDGTLAGQLMKIR